jgi:hypothetical protein
MLDENRRRWTSIHQDSSSTSVDWSTDSFRLTASHFYYQENGKEPKYFENDGDYIIVPSQLTLSDSQWSDSFDISWTGSNDGLENRIFLYFIASPLENHWEVFSASMYGENQALIHFNSDINGPPLGGISGTIGKCFKSDSTVIVNANGDFIIFENLRLGAFLGTDSWNDKEYNDCFGNDTSSGSSSFMRGSGGDIMMLCWRKVLIVLAVLSSFFL